METQTTPDVQQDIVITERAAEQVRRIKSENSIPETHALRIGVKGGGCSGLSYVLGFEEQPREQDHVYSLEGMKVFVDPKSLEFLAGMTLDFSGGLNGKGFVFNNPNAKKTCGCGQSFCG